MVVRFVDVGVVIAIVAVVSVIWDAGVHAKKGRKGGRREEKQMMHASRGRGGARSRWDRRCKGE